MSPRRRLVPAVLAAAAAAALLLTGCAPVAATSTARGADGGGTAPASTAGWTGSTSGSKVFADPAECASIARQYGSVGSALLPVLQGSAGPTPFDADQLGRAVSTDTMGTIPAELTPDFAAFATAARQLRGKNRTAAAALLHGLEVSTATAHIEKFLSDHC